MRVRVRVRVRVRLRLRLRLRLRVRLRVRVCGVVFPFRRVSPCYLCSFILFFFAFTPKFIVVIIASVLQTVSADCNIGNISED